MVTLHIWDVESPFESDILDHISQSRVLVTRCAHNACHYMWVQFPPLQPKCFVGGTQ